MLYFSGGVDEQFEVTEELLNLTTMHGKATVKNIFQQLSDTVEHVGCN